MRSHVWHPNTQMSEWDKFDCIVRGDGMWLEDSGGHRMLDAVASMWCNVWGHSEPELVEALCRQARTLPHSPLFNLTHPAAERLADLLVRACPGMGRVFYSDDGSTAMEVAFKMAVQYWQNRGCAKTRLVGLANGYHGDTVGPMSVGYSDAFFGAYRSMIPQHLPIYAPTPGHGAADWDGTLERISAALESRDDVAAVVMESGAQTAGGVAIYPDRFQARVHDACRRNEALLVVDEVATGLGRLGHMAEYDAQGCRPDIASYGKMLTAGYVPLAATLTTEEVYDAFLGRYDEGAHLFHGHTFSGNPLGAAVACRNLELYEERDLMRHVLSVSRLFADAIDAMADEPRVIGVRRCGLLAGIDVNMDAGAGLSANRIMYKAGREHGVYLRTLGNTVLAVPPLAASEEELSGMLAGILDAILSV